jgi:hypothetical protein
MGFATQETIDRVTRVLEGNNYESMMAVLRETPICPPSDAGKDLKVSVETGSKNSPGGRKRAADALTAQWHKHKVQDLEDMVGFIKLGAHFKGDFMGALTFIVSTARNLPSAASRVGWIPCWYLPWGSGKIYKIKIRSNATDPVLNFGNNIDPMPNPRLFFTAAINGCSVFAVGNEANPSLYHGGFDPGDLTSPVINNETTEEAWRRLLGRVNTQKTVRSVGKSDYIVELNHVAWNDQMARDDMRVRVGFRSTGPKTTTRAAELEQFLQTNHQITLTSVNPWGAVFGLRADNNAWHFVLVKNAQVNYHRFFAQATRIRHVKTTLGSVRLPDKDIPARTEGEMMPKKVPLLETGGRVDLNAAALEPTAEVIIRRSVNLGYLEFFPGAGQAYYRDLASVITF